MDAKVHCSVWTGQCTFFVCIASLHLYIVHKKCNRKLNKTNIVAKKTKLNYNSNGRKILQSDGSKRGIT